MYKFYIYRRCSVTRHPLSPPPRRTLTSASSNVPTISKTDLEVCIETIQCHPRIQLTGRVFRLHWTLCNGQNRAGAMPNGETTRKLHLLYNTQMIQS